jgi:hypothetical protein
MPIQPLEDESTTTVDGGGTTIVPRIDPVPDTDEPQEQLPEERVPVEEIGGTIATAEADPEIIDLRDAVRIIPDPLNSFIERAYVLSSNRVLDPFNIILINCALNMEVVVGFAGPESVEFVQKPTVIGDVGVGGEPITGITLQPQQQFDLQVRFKSDKLNELPEGINASELVFTLSAGTISIPTCEDGTIEIRCPGDPEVPPPVQTWTDCETGQVHDWPPPADWVQTVEGCWVAVTPPPAQTWVDCDSGETREGLPPDGWILTDAGCWKAPAPPVAEVTLDITWTESDPLILAGGKTTARGTLFADLQGDDPTLYHYDWNFDVSDQGAEFGETQMREPIVSYPMSTRDQQNIQSTGRTTRRVKVTVTKGNDFVISREEIIVINDPRLVGDVGTGGGDGGPDEPEIIRE